MTRPHCPRYLGLERPFRHTGRLDQARSLRRRHRVSTGNRALARSSGVGRAEGLAQARWSKALPGGLLWQNARWQETGRQVCRRCSIAV